MQIGITFKKLCNNTYNACMRCGNGWVGIDLYWKSRGRQRSFYDKKNEKL